MKSVLKYLSVVLCIAFVLASCSKDDNPSDNNVFAGTYKGKVMYNDGDQNKSNDNGSVFVTKVGDRYDFKFSDDIPAITNVDIEKGDNGYIGTVNGYTGLIKFDANNLNINVTKGGAIWSANCNR